jgi:hypothetical protein
VAEKWTVVGPDKDPYEDIELHADGRRFARLWQDDAPVHDYNAAQWERARLAAAAPELLASLCELLPWAAGHLEGRSNAHDAMLDRARAAIARAEGR